MKLIEVLNYINRYHKEQEKLLHENKTQEAKTKISNTVDEIVSKKDVNEEWKNTGVNKKEFIDKIITLLSQAATLEEKELEETYDVNKIKTIYYLVHNSNKDMLNVINNIQERGITKSGEPGLLKKIQDMLFYTEGEYIENLNNFYKNIDGNPLDLSDIAKENDIRNNNDIIGKIAKVTNLPVDCVNKIAKIQGSEATNRSSFEVLLALVLRNCKLCKSKRGDIEVNNNGSKKYIEVKNCINSARLGNPGNDLNTVYAIFENAFNNLKIKLNNLFKNLKENVSNETNTNNVFSGNTQENQVNELDINTIIPEQNNLIKSINIDRLRKSNSAKSIDLILSEIANRFVQLLNNNSITLNDNISSQLKDIFVDCYSEIMCAPISNKKYKDILKGHIKNLISNIAFEKIRNGSGIIEDFESFRYFYTILFLKMYQMTSKFDYIFLFGETGLLTIPKDYIHSLDNKKVINLIKVVELPRTYGNPGRALSPAIKLDESSIENLDEIDEN